MVNKNVHEIKRKGPIMHMHIILNMGVLVWCVRAHCYSVVGN